MRPGILCYDAQDYERNASYIEWLTRSAQDFGLSLELATFPTRELEIESAIDTVLPDEHPICRFVDRLARSNPPFLINRTRSALFARYAEHCGYRVFNHSLVAYLGNDKIAGYRWATNLGISVSPLISEPKVSDFPLVQKPVFGHGGRNVALLDSPAEYRPLSEPYLLQKPVRGVIGDIRFYVIGGKCVHSVLRKGNGSFASNYSLGGSIEIFHPTPEQNAVVRRILDNLFIDYAGVDFLLTDKGQLYFNEIEDVVGSRMLSDLGCNDTTERFFSHIVETLDRCYNQRE